MSTNLIRTAVVAVVAGMGFAVAAAGPALSQAAGNCDWYAKTALKQQQENEQRKCGFTGPAWTTDLKAHMTWCTVNPDQWKSEAQRREQQLASCKK
jgi:hypothetical protein